MSTAYEHNPENGWPKSNGMTVPDGYFEDFTRRMMQQLPDRERETESERPRRKLWLTLRPYVYMAAMFAGIYLMLNIFTLTTGLRGDKNAAASEGTLLAEVVNTGTSSYVDEYISMSNYDLYNDLYEAGYEIPE